MRAQMTVRHAAPAHRTAHGVTVRPRAEAHPGSASRRSWRSVPSHTTRTVCAACAYCGLAGYLRQRVPPGPRMLHSCAAASVAESPPVPSAYRTQCAVRGRPGPARVPLPLPCTPARADGARAQSVLTPSGTSDEKKMFDWYACGRVLELRPPPVLTGALSVPRAPCASCLDSLRHLAVGCGRSFSRSAGRDRTFSCKPCPRPTRRHRNSGGNAAVASSAVEPMLRSILADALSPRRASPRLVLVAPAGWLRRWSGIA